MVLSGSTRAISIQKRRASRMSRLAVLLVVAVLALFAGSVELGVLPNPFASVMNGGDQGLFAFSMSRNEFGDRIYLSAPVHITYVPQPGAPDRVDIAPLEGTLEGNFHWVVIQRQGGENRLLGEFNSGGRAYRVCEFLLTSAGGGASRAERYYPINNSGPRFRDPEQIDTASLGTLFNAIVAEEPLLKNVPKGSTEAVAISRPLARSASDMVYFCINQTPPRRR
jgi:hypothetical protein